MSLTPHWTENHCRLSSTAKEASSKLSSIAEQVMLKAISKGCCPLGPSKLGPCFCTSFLCSCNLVFEKLFECCGNGIWRSAFDHVSVWQPMAQHLAETTWPGQAHIVCQPKRLFRQISRKQPMHNEAWVGSLSLHPMKHALLQKQHTVRLTSTGFLKPGLKNFHFLATGCMAMAPFMSQPPG